MANLSSKTGFTPVQTQVALTLSGTTSVQNFAAYSAQELTGFVEVLGTTTYRTAVTVMVVKNGAGTYEVASVDLAGDNYSSAPLVAFSMSGTNLQATLPVIAGATSAKIYYQLSAPALGGQFPLTVDSTSINVSASAPLSYRNKIINGNFDIWQRGTSITQTQDIASINSYTADRWKMGAVRDAIAWRQITVAREATVVPTNARYAAKITLGATDCNRMNIEQRIESANSFVFSSQNGILQFKLRRIATLHASTYLKVEISSPNAIDDYTTSTIRTTKTFTNISALSNTDYTTFTVDVPFSAAFSNGMSVALTLITDSASTPLAGSGDFLYFAQAQMEVGSSATAFEQRPIGMEVGLCQRYLQRLNQTDGSYSINLIGFRDASYFNFAVKMSPAMRSAPTLYDPTYTFSGLTAGQINLFNLTAGSAVTLSGASGAWDLTQGTTEKVTLRFTATSLSGTTGNVCSADSLIVGSKFFLNAEL